MNCRIRRGERRHAPRSTLHAPRPARAAFSLLEVMVACGIFFIAVFAILAMISSVLRNARSLRRMELDAGMVAAQVCNTNKLTEGSASGDFGKMYPDYSWESDSYEVATNGLWEVDIVVRRRGLQKPVDVMSIWLYRPESQSGFGRPNIR
jgi:Tfp pilus assembly protein PilV